MTQHAMRTLQSRRRLTVAFVKCVEVLLYRIDAGNINEQSELGKRKRHKMSMVWEHFKLEN